MNIIKSVGNFFKASSKPGLVPSYVISDTDTQRELFTKESAVTVETLYDVVKQSPELLGTLQVIIHDIIADGWRFNGSNFAVEKAENFSQKTNLFKLLGDALWDLLITGDAFILKIANSEEDIKTIATETINKIGIDIDKEMIIKQLLEKIQRRTQKLQILKSGTITGVFDKNGNVKKWIQRVGTDENQYDPEDVIHLSIMNIGGDIYGWTPLQPLLSDIGTLIYAKSYVSKVYENQGVPPIMFNLPDASGEEDRNYQLLKKNLEDMKSKRNKLKSFITTGNIKHEQIRILGDEFMPSRDIISHLTNLIMFSWGVPPTRVPHFQLTRGNARFPKESNDGYFKSILYIQKTLEPQLNYQLFWKEFRVKFEFSKAYRVDELREANINAILWDRNGQSIEEGRRRIGLPEKIPEGETLPIFLQQKEKTRFREQEENRVGTDREEQDYSIEPEENQDNKLRSIINNIMG